MNRWLPRRAMKLRTHLVLLVLAVLLPTLAFLAATLVHFVRREHAAVEQGFVATARAISVALDQQLEDSVRELQALAKSESLDAGDLPAFYRESAVVRAAHPDWLTIALMDPEGHQVFNLLRPFGAALGTTANPDFVKHVVETGQPAVSGLFEGHVSGKPIVGIGIPVVRAGRPKLVLAAAIGTGTIERVLARQKIPADWTGTVLDRQHVLVARTRDPQQHVGQLAGAKFVGKITAADEGSFRGVTRDGRPVYTAFSRSPLSGWTVTLGVPVETVDASFWRLVWTLGLGGLALALVGAGLAFVVSRRIAAAAASLASAAEALGRGETPRLGVSAVAEVNTVARSIEAAGTARAHAQETTLGLVEVGHEVAASLDVAQATDRIAATVLKLFGARESSLWLLDSASGSLGCIVIAGAADGEECVGRFLPSGAGIVGRAVLRQQPVRADDVLQEPGLALPDWILARARAAGHRAVAAAPLRAHGETLGALFLADGAGRTFTDEELRLLAAFADQAAVVLQNARLYEAQTLKTRRLKTLNRLNQAVSSSLDLRQTLAAITTAAGELVGAVSVSVWIADDAAQTLERHTALFNEYPRPVLRCGEGIVGWAAALRQTVNVPDVFVDTHILSPEWFRSRGLRSALCVPILDDARLLGVLALYGPQPFVLEPEMQELIDSFVAHASAAVRNARLYQETERRRHEAETLASLGHMLAGTLDPGVVGQRTADSVRSLLGARHAALYRLVSETSALQAIAFSGDTASMWWYPVIPPGMGAGGLAVRERRAVTTADLLDDPRVGIPPEERAAIGAVPERALLSAPLFVEDRVIGVLSVSDTTGRVFNGEEARLMETFAATAALALENARLYDEAGQRRSEAEALERSARALTQSLDPGAVGRRIVDSVVTLFHVRSAVLRLLEPDGRLRLVAVSGHSADYYEPGHLLPSGEGTLAAAIAAGTPVLVADKLDDPRIHFGGELRARVERWDERAGLAVPLRTKHDVIGALGISDRAGRAFSDGDAALLQAFADHAATALENSRLYADAERRRAEAETLAGLARTIGAALDLDAVLHQAVEAARNLSGSDLAQIALRDPESDRMVLRYGAGGARDQVYKRLQIERGKGIGGLAWERRWPVRTDNHLEDPRISRDYDDAVRAERVVTALAVPIIIGEEVEGLLYVSNRSPRPFTVRDEAVLMRLAGHAAIAIQNARLFERVQGASERLAALSRRLLEVQEADHRHLARELHDEIGQALTAVKLNLQTLQARGTFSSRIEQSLEIVDHALEQVRGLSHALRPSVLDDLGLAAALRWFVRREAQRAGLETEIDVEPLDPRPAAEIETACFRIAQEALTNVVRHAKAHRVSVVLRRQDGALELTLLDDGVGFDVADARKRATLGGSMGLLGMEERATIAGGRLDLRSAPDFGTMVRARLPLRVTDAS